MIVTILFLPLSQTEIIKMEVHKTLIFTSSTNVHKTGFPLTKVNTNGGCLRTGTGGDYLYLKETKRHNTENKCTIRSL